MYKIIFVNGCYVGISNGTTVVFRILAKKLHFLERLQPASAAAFRGKGKSNLLLLSPSHKIYIVGTCFPKKIKHQQQKDFPPRLKEKLFCHKLISFFFPSLFFCAFVGREHASPSSSPPQITTGFVREKTHILFLKGGKTWVGWLTAAANWTQLCGGERGVRTLLLLSFPRI